MGTAPRRVRIETASLRWAWRLPRNEKVGGLITLGALYFLQRAYFFYSRYRRAADAGYAKAR